MIGAASELDKLLVKVNRTEEWQDDGIAYKPNTSHCKKVVETLNLQHEKSVITSVARRENVDREGIETALGSRCGPCMTRARKHQCTMSWMQTRRLCTGAQWPS